MKIAPWAALTVDSLPIVGYEAAPAAWVVVAGRGATLAGPPGRI